jgi:hypothetical protein
MRLDLIFKTTEAMVVLYGSTLVMATQNEIVSSLFGALNIKPQKDGGRTDHA